MRKIIKWFTLLASLALTTAANAQVLVRVLVIDSESQLGVSDVRVVINGEFELNTDTAGLFAIELPGGEPLSLQLAFQRLGYQTKTSTLQVTGDQPVDAVFTLAPSAVGPYAGACWRSISRGASPLARSSTMSPCRCGCR